MSHRHHKSTKVPNVKLRPVARSAGGAGTAAASPTSLDDLSLNRTLEAQYAERDRLDDRKAKRRRVVADERYDHDDDEDRDDGDGDDDLPLKGAFFCFTGVGDEKTALAQAATSLGATVDGDLTETTTHLIAITCGSQKYKFALHLGLYILRPSFLYTLHERWQQAQPTEIDTLLSAHALPPLQGLVVGLAGISDRDSKASLKQRLTHMGARLEFPMTFDSGVTHLICGVASRKESNTLDTVWQLRKNHVGTAEERKGATQLHCVWLDWVDDCDRVGGSLPEEKYDIWASVSGRKSTRPVRTTREQIRAAFPTRDPVEMKRRYADKVRENQQGYVKKLQQVAKGGGDQRAQTESGDGGGRTAVTLNVPTNKITAPTAANSKPTATHPNSGLLAMSRNVTEEHAPPPPPPPQPQPQSQPQPPTAGPLASAHIQLDLSPRDDNKLDLAREACHDGGARLVVDERQWPSILRSNNPHKAAYLVVSIQCPTPQREKQLALQSRLRTEHNATLHLVTLYWLEQCLFWEQLIDPQDTKRKDPTGYPYLPILTAPSPSLPRSLNYTIALTNFYPQDHSPHRSHLTQAFVAMGCKVTETFGKKQNTHLFSRYLEELQPGETWEQFGSRKSVRVLKEIKAGQWGIPVLGLGFLTRAWSEGVVRDDERARDDGTKAVEDMRANARSLRDDERARDDRTKAEEEMRANTQSVLDETQFDVSSMQADTPHDGKEEQLATLVRTDGARSDHDVVGEPSGHDAAGEPSKHDAAGERSELPDGHAAGAQRRDESTEPAQAGATHDAPLVDRSAASGDEPTAPLTSPAKRSDTLKGPTAVDSQAVIAPAAAESHESQASPTTAPPHVYVQETLAGQSMWATRMQDEVEALLSSRSGPTSSKSSNRKGRRSTGTGSSKRSLTPHSTISPHKEPTEILTTLEHEDETEQDDESMMRVTYRDPVAEKERRRLEELVERGQREREREREQQQQQQDIETQTKSPSPPRLRQDTFGSGKNRPPTAAIPPSSQKRIVARRQPGSAR